jgi:hypothetical protein
MENRCPVLGLMSRRPCGQRQRPCARRPAIHTDIEKRGWRTAVAESRTTGAVVLKMECGGVPRPLYGRGLTVLFYILRLGPTKGFFGAERVPTADAAAIADVGADIFVVVAAVDEAIEVLTLRTVGLGFSLAVELALRRGFRIHK